MNRIWHEVHPMPRSATTEQRISWHVAHAKNCGCRPIPVGVLALMQERDMTSEPSLYPPIPMSGVLRAHSAGLPRSIELARRRPTPSLVEVPDGGACAQ